MTAKQTRGNRQERLQHPEPVADSSRPQSVRLLDLRELAAAQATATPERAGGREVWWREVEHADVRVDAGKPVHDVLAIGPEDVVPLHVGVADDVEAPSAS